MLKFYICVIIACLPDFRFLTENPSKFYFGLFEFDGNFIFHLKKKKKIFEIFGWKKFLLCSIFFHFVLWTMSMLFAEQHITLSVVTLIWSVTVLSLMLMLKEFSHGSVISQFARTNLCFPLSPFRGTCICNVIWWIAAKDILRSLIAAHR